MVGGSHRYQAPDEAMFQVWLVGGLCGMVVGHGTGLGSKTMFLWNCFRTRDMVGVEVPSEAGFEVWPVGGWGPQWNGCGAWGDTGWGAGTGAAADRGLRRSRPPVSKQLSDPPPTGWMCLRLAPPSLLSEPATCDHLGLARL